MALSQYIIYMQQVLGVREVLFNPQATAEGELPVAHHPDRKVLFIDSKKWSPQGMELFTKMREAMKLTADEIKILFCETTAIADIHLQCFQSQEIVSFDEQVFESLKSEFGPQLTLTVGPEKLLKDSAQKKIAWSDLQNVMKRLH